MITKKVQIFYASIGSGHLVAARSISQAIKDINPEIEIELQDIFGQSKLNVFFQEILAFLPNLVFPELYTRIWRSGSFKWLYDLACSFGPIRRKILRKIQLYSPDLLICTHTFPCTVISNWKTNHYLPPLMAVATDQFVHDYWPIKRIDAFISPNLLMEKELIRRGLEKKRIYTFGIPVAPSLREMTHKLKSRKKIKIIVLAGSYRVAPYLTIYKRVKELLAYLEFHQSRKIIWQFVFGASNRLKKIAQHKLINRKDIDIYDFPENVQMLMADSDFVFTKPGGLTVAEALALKKPIILLSAGSGQERENSDFVINSGLGVLLDKEVDLIHFTEELMQNPQSIQNRFSQPSKSMLDSAQQVAHLALRLMEKVK